MRLRGFSQKKPRSCFLCDPSRLRFETETVKVAGAHAWKHHGLVVRGKAAKEIVRQLFRSKRSQVCYPAHFTAGHVDTKNRLLIGQKGVNKNCLAVATPDWIGGAGRSKIPPLPGVRVVESYFFLIKR